MKSKGRILLVEDNEELNMINQEALEMQGYTVTVATSAAQAKVCLSTSPADVIILDVLLPDQSGMDFCRELKRKYSIPILFLSALGTSDQKVKGLWAGGDDYMAKPYLIDELCARVEALMRRTRPAKQETKAITMLTYGPLTLNLTTLTAFVDGRDAMLTPREFSLLLALVHAEKEVVSTKELYSLAWGMHAADEAHAVRVQMSRLRKKIKACCGEKVELNALRGRGYQLIIYHKRMSQFRDLL